MMSLTFGLFNQVSGLGPLGPLVLLNPWTEFEIISQECCLGNCLPKLLKPFRSIEQDGRHS